MARAASPPARRPRRGTRSPSQDEGVAAWRRFLESLAEERPLVLVFEDLHWADDVLLDFVDELVERASSVPLLVLGTARPELLQRRPGWGGGKPNALTISLPPLSDEETRSLLESLLEQTRRRTCRRRSFSPAPAATRSTPSSTPACSSSEATCESCPRRCRGSSPRGSTGSPRGEAAAPRRGRRRQGVLARSRRGRRRRHALAGRGAAPRARAQGVRAAVAQLLGGDRERVRVPARADPRRRLRPDPACGAIGEASASGGAGSSRSDARRSRPSCLRTTICRRSSWRRRQGSTTRRSRRRPGCAARRRRSGRGALRGRGGGALLRRGATAVAGRRPRAGPAAPAAGDSGGSADRRRRSRAACRGKGCAARSRRQVEGRRSARCSSHRPFGSRVNATSPIATSRTPRSWSQTSLRRGREGGCLFGQRRGRA